MDEKLSSEPILSREKTARIIEDFNNLDAQEPSTLNAASRWVIDRLTSPRRIHEISTSHEGWIEDLRRGLSRNSRHPIDINVMRIAQFDGGKSLEELPSILVRLDSPSKDMKAIGEHLVAFLSTKLSYTEEELREIMEHELDHFEKADELQIDLSGSTLQFRIYNAGYDDSDKRLSLSVGMVNEIPPIEDMEICLAPEKPSEPDFARFMGLLTKLDLKAVEDLDKLYNVIRIYCEKSDSTFTTDIPELYREYRGVKLLEPRDYDSIEVDTRIEVNGRNYLFRKIEGDKIIVANDYGEHEITLDESVEVCIDR